MRFWLFLFLLSGLVMSRPAMAQSNDGFQRLNGQMYVVRNGQRRPMTQDAHLPTGATLTKDGVLLSAAGQRTELREGQGCDLRGRVTAVVDTGRGVVLASPGRRGTEELAPMILADFLEYQVVEDEGYRGRGHAWGRKKKGKKHKGHDD